jgi:hypothetical protein
MTRSIVLMLIGVNVPRRRRADWENARRTDCPCDKYRIKHVGQVRNWQARSTPYRTAARRKPCRQFEIGIRQCEGRIRATCRSAPVRESEAVARDCASQYPKPLHFVCRNVHDSVGWQAGSAAPFGPAYPSPPSSLMGDDGGVLCAR